MYMYVLCHVDSIVAIDTSSPDSLLLALLSSALAVSSLVCLRANSSLVLPLIALVCSAVVVLYKSCSNPAFHIYDDVWMYGIL